MNKKIYYTFAGVFVPIILITILFNKGGYVLKDTKKDTFNNFCTISLMLETSANSGNYELSTSDKWPTSGYVYNAELSSCENGSTLIYNAETNKVTLKANKSDKCYVYFDVEPPDISVAVSNLPETVGPLAQLNCSGATTTYNNKYNRIEVSQINSRGVSCNLNYSIRTTKEYLNNKIISLAGTTQGTGQVVQEKGYRYEGKNPNNWVWFNNELWRIIGVFDAETHGQTGLNLVKIIRANPIGGLAWNKANTNDWANASLKNLLNGAYYNKENGNGNEYCYMYSTSVAGNCDYTSIGIDATYRSMIKSVTWKVGGHTTSGATAEAIYTAERGSATGNSNGYASEVIGEIGLMYASDYGYSVLASSCARTTYMSSYSSSQCAGQSWLGGQGYEWTLTPFSSNSNNVFPVYHDGSLDLSHANYGYAARPNLYLDASVYVVDGEGTEANPYIIGM